MIYITLESNVPSDLDSRFRIALEQKFSQLSQMLYDKVIENLSGKILRQKTGQLLESIRQETDVGSDPMMTIIGPEPATPKAWALEEGGTKSYIIVPVRAGALHFYWEKIGQEVWFPAVNHPPSQKFGYLSNALAEMHEPFVEGMRETAQEALGG